MSEGPVGVITGGGSGIGAATAVEFARRGARLTLASLPTPGLARTVAAVEQAGGAAVPVEMDVRDPAAVQQLIEMMRETMRDAPGVGRQNRPIIEFDRLRRQADSLSELDPNADREPPSIDLPSKRFCVLVGP